MTEHSRRAVLKGGLTVAGASVLGQFHWVLPALAQGEVPVPFIDYPADFLTEPTDITRRLDIRTINGPFTPADRFYTLQHYGHPTVDLATYRLKVTGLVDRPREFTVDELAKLATTELRAAFECSGNRAAGMQSLVGNGRWTGLPLQRVLKECGVKASGNEVVFFGADRGEEEVEWRTQKFKVEQQFGRSLPRAVALSAEPFLAWQLNGAPLSVHQGAPLRLIVPGWYGVANVKWLSQIHVQADRYLGKYQARWYRTLRGETINGEVKWTETDVAQMNLKSVVARVTRTGNVGKVLGFVLNDGTPIKSVEVRVDDGPWQPAVLDPSTTSRYEWKLFTYTWNNPTPGQHTLVSRVTDVNGLVQPTADDLKNKLTFLEDNAQFPRKVLVG